MPINRKNYDEDLKKRAVRMSYSSERSLTDVADSLGITTGMIYCWRKTFTPDGDKTQQAQQHEDNQALRKRIAELEEENYILKKLRPTSRKIKSKEIVHWYFYPTREQVRQAIFEYIETFYNRQRVLKQFGYLSPIYYLNSWQHKHTPSAA